MHPFVRGDLDGVTPATGAGSTSQLNLTVVVGFSVAGAMLVGLAVVLLIRHIRRRKKESAKQAAQHQKPVQTNAPHPSTLKKKRNPSDSGQAVMGAVSQHGRTDSTVSLLPKTELVQPWFTGLFHASHQTPRLISTQLTTNLINNANGQNRSMPGPRTSVADAWWNTLRFSTLIAPPARRSLVYDLSGLSMRTMISTFDPVLPDELFISVGEQVHVLLSYDDSWCMVRRDRFGVSELGLVPSACWDPLYGGTVRCPTRKASLGGISIECADALEIGLAL